MKLRGKGIVITGANRGLGREIARACVAEGANVLLCAREGALLEQTCAELNHGAADGQHILSQVTDVSQPEEVRELISCAESSLPQIHGLVNNAAILGPKDLAENAEWKEWVRTIEINLLGTVLTCRAVLPVFRRHGYGKIVNLSGGGATSPRPRFSAYAASKAAVVRFTETLAEETKGSGIDVNAVAPGALNTRLLNEVVAAGPEKVGSEYERALKQKEGGGESLEKAAELCLFLLSSESDGISGKLVSAVWDPWPTLAERRAELKQTDIYTLRRILPEDRGLNWN
jgi:NAD(P)-dependent dehydrogenase (short-subunit alcohol dehydrogenase family)